MKDKTIQSEQVVVEAPFSFTGATKRIWPVVAKVENKNVRVFVVAPIVVVVLIFVYSFILIWYLAFGLLIVPFRLIRRSQRNKKKQELQHREMLAAMARNNTPHQPV